VIRQITVKEALKAYMEGEKVICMEPEPEESGTYNAYTLASVLNGLVFLVDKKTTRGNQMPEDVVPVMTENKPVAVNPPPEAKPKRQNVDIGKILALRNAGWDYAKIADEMRLTVKQVGNYIYRYKERVCEEK